MNAQAIINQAKELKRGSLDEFNGKQILSEFSIPVPRSTVVARPSEVADAVTDMVAPFVVKVMSAEILHKSDAGGVALHLQNTEEVAEAIAVMSESPLIKPAKVDGYLVEEMSPKGTEVVVGAVRDPDFGPLLMVGLGGIFVEVLKDVAFRICPVSRHDAQSMLNELRGAKILDGARGQPGIDKEALIDVLLSIGGEDGLLMTLGDDISELDINPIIATPKGVTAVDARFILSSDSIINTKTADKPYADLPVVERFMPLFKPKTIAVLGASTTQTSIANTFIRRLKDFGYNGNLYPIHPKAEEVEGLKCYPSLADTPEPVDYAYVAINSNRIPDALGVSNGNVRFAQVISSGFGEVEEGKQLQKELIEKAHQGGCRVIGPNCLGVYSPRGGVTFSVGAPQETGTIGIVTQSGGLGTDIIKRGQWRGVRFSGLVTVGNSADLGPVDLFEFYMQDPETRAIGLYIEDIKEGRRFFDLLRSESATKPVVILRGGTSSQGKQAAASHTGALAGDNRAWDALTRQTGCVLVETVDEFINALLAFQFIDVRPSRPTKQVTLFGNGGGTSVLATDYFSGLGLDVAPFGDEAREKLEAMNLPPGTSVANPIDTPVRTLQEENGLIANRILETVYELASPDAVVMHLNLAAFVGRGDIDPIDNLIKAAEQVQEKYQGQAHFMLALRVDGSPELDIKMREYRERALGAGIPVYDELATAGKALQAISWVEHNFAERGVKL